MKTNTIYDFDKEHKRTLDRVDGVTAENKVSLEPKAPTPSNTVYHFKEEEQRGNDRLSGYTAEKPKPLSVSNPSSIYQNPIPNLSAPKTTPVPKPRTGYQYLDQAQGIQQVGRLKDAYSEGQQAFHSSDVATGFRDSADKIRSDYKLSDAQYGSGVTSRDVYNRWEKIHELGTIKSEYEKNYALDPNYANSEDAINKRKRAGEIRTELGLADEEYGSGVSGAEVLKKASGIKSLYDVKNSYENYWNNSPEAKGIRESADSVRRIYGLSDEDYGSGVSSETVDENLTKLLYSPEYQRDLSYQKYQDNNQAINDEIQRELTDEVKMRAILDRVKAQEIAEGLIGEQLDKEIRDSLNYEDELAAQRGSYGQLSYGKRRALKEGQMQNSKAARVLNLVNSLISEDAQKAEAEYKEAVGNKNNRLSALNQRLTQNQNEFMMGQQYRGEISQEAAAKQEAIANAVKEQYNNAFEMSNALGYITPELSALTGIEAGTPMFKMVEYYGSMERFYAELEQKAQFQAQDMAIAQYNAETDRMYASRPSYSGGYNGGYSGKKTYSQNDYNDYSKSDTLTGSQANAAFENFSSDFSEENGKKPSAVDTINWASSVGYSEDDQNQILLAAGFTPKDVHDAEVATPVYNAVDNAKLPQLTKSWR